MLRVDFAYSLLHVKSLDDEQRIIRGIATTPTPDRGDDIVDPIGVQFHDPDPVSPAPRQTHAGRHRHFDRPTTRTGIGFTRAGFRRSASLGIVRDRTDEAWHSAKYKLLCGISHRIPPAEVRATRDRSATT